MGERTKQPSLQFLGGAGAVTGSKFLVSAARGRVLVDAGLYQGPGELRRRNWEPLPVDATSIDAVALTHAHLDHCGYLPRLVQEGFSGDVVCTDETAELAEIVLRDSAHLMDEDASDANARGYSKHHPALPLYDEADVEKALALVRGTRYGDREGLADGVEACFRSAGHILGSATVELRADGRSILFSGDLGRPSHPLVPPRVDPPAADTVVVESTYGNRRHAPSDSTVMADAIRRALGRGGLVLIPAFAVDRTELVLLQLGELMSMGVLPEVPVYLDSPMALRVLDVYSRALRGSGFAPDFGVPSLHVAPSAADSQRLNHPQQPCIIVSASGMASGGRVVHHLAEQLPDERNCVILTGYQAVGTRGRALAEGARAVKVHGRYVPVRAEVVQDPSLSAHADSDEIIGWLGSMPSPPRTTYVVHGEHQASEALARRIRNELGWLAVVPRPGERVLLD